MELTENAKKLFEMLFTTEFNAEQLKTQLTSGCYNFDDINIAAFQYVERCNGIIDEDECEKYAFGEIIPGYESSHLLEAIKILLAYGLDPNYVVDECLYSNIMCVMHFVHNGYQAADAAALMLEHGGNPNLVVNGESLVADLCGDISWFLGGDVESRYIADAFMHYFMVLLGYGSKFVNGAEMVTVYDGFKVSDFRNHRRYYCGFIHGAEKNTSWVSFFDKTTNWEVARF